MKAPLRITLSMAATNTLKQLSSRTGLSPNIVARFAILASLELLDQPIDDAGTPDLTINQATLFGDLEPFLMAAISYHARQAHSTSPSRLVANHIARGASILHAKIVDIPSIARLAVV